MLQEEKDGSPRGTNKKHTRGQTENIKSSFITILKHLQWEEMKQQVKEQIKEYIKERDKDRRTDR